MATDREHLIIREAEPGDRDAWIGMWDDFVTAKPSEPGERDLGRLNWGRIADPQCPMRCIVAAGSDRQLYGFITFTMVCWSWSSLPVCYLLDVFVRADARGRGIGRRLLERMGSIGRYEGWYKIFWMTESDNARAQALYRSFAKQMDYIRFDWPIAQKGGEDC